MGLSSSDQRRRRGVYQVTMSTVCLSKTKILSISGNPNHHRPLPSNKKPQKEPSVRLSRRPWLPGSLRLRLRTCVGSPVLTCIRGELITEDRPIGCFYFDVTDDRRGVHQEAECQLGSCPIMFPRRPRELQSAFTRLFHTSGFVLSG